jgi:hypothetical protein
MGWSISTCLFCLGEKLVYLVNFKNTNKVLNSDSNVRLWYNFGNSTQVVFFYVHVTVRRNKFLYNKTN